MVKLKSDYQEVVLMLWSNGTGLVYKGILTLLCKEVHNENAVELVSEVKHPAKYGTSTLYEHATRDEKGRGKKNEIVYIILYDDDDDVDDAVGEFLDPALNRLLALI